MWNARPGPLTVTTKPSEDESRDRKYAPSELSELLLPRQPHHLIDSTESSAHSTVPLKWNRDSPLRITSSTTMSLTVKTDSAISGRGM